MNVVCMHGSRRGISNLMRAFRLTKFSPHEYHLVHIPTGQYVVTHENKKHVYFSNRPMAFVLNEHKVLISAHNTKIWMNEHDELWQHESGDDDSDSLCCESPPTSPAVFSADHLRALSEHFRFDYYEGLDMLFQEEQSSAVKEDFIATTTTPLRMMRDVIRSQTEREEQDNDPWKGSVFEDIQHLKCNNVGNVGEHMLKNLCEHTGLRYVYEGSKNRNHDQGTFDILIENQRVECKTARLGKHGSFQHETIRKNGCDFHVFVDICPHYYYLTVLPKMSFEQIQELTGRKPHPRKGTNDVFKLDFGESTFLKLIERGHTVRVSDTTTEHAIHTFLHNHFKT